MEGRSDFCGEARIRVSLCGFAAQQEIDPMRDEEWNNERTADDLSFGQIVIGPSGYYAAA